MKHRNFLCSLFLLMTVSVHAEKKEPAPVITLPVQAASSITAGVATTYNSAFLSDEVLAPITHFTENQPKILLNHFKGDLGESLMDNVFTKTFLERTGRWSRLTPTSVGRTGIDGLYIKLDANGMPRSCLIADAKVDGSRLGMTKDGKQMSDAWIRPRVARTAKTYRNLSRDLQSATVVRVSRGEKNLATDRISVPINDKFNVEIWKTKNGYAFFSEDKTVTVVEVQRQSGRCADFLDGVASGNCKYRAREFRYQASGEEHVIKISQLDENGKIIRSKVDTGGNTIKVKPQIIRGKFENLPPDVQKGIEVTARETLKVSKGQFGLDKYDSNSKVFDKLVDECCKNPEKFNKLCIEPKLNPNIIRGGVTITSAMVLAGVLDPVTQYLSTGTVDWKRTGCTSLLSGGGASLGLATNALMASRSGLLATAGARMFGSGSIAAIFVSYGMYFCGYGTLGNATQSAAIGVASAGLVAATPAVLIGIATCFGTTSTGVAISSLSGAAATHAAIAWLGGGAVAAGGGGMAAGGALIATVTGGVAIALIAVPIIWETCKYFKNVKSQRVFMEELIHFTKNRVHAGKQREWPLLAH